MIWNIPYTDLPTNLHTCCIWVDSVTRALCTPGNITHPTTGNICGFIGNGLCLVERIYSSFDCTDSIPINKSIDICDLTASAWAQLNKESLNMFSSAYIAEV